MVGLFVVFCWEFLWSFGRKVILIGNIGTTLAAKRVIQRKKTNYGWFIFCGGSMWMMKF